MINFSGPLIDRQLIRELLGAYSDATFQRDMNAWLACYADDGVWVMLGKEIKGKAALQKQWTKLWSTIERMAFFTEIGAISVTGDHATARSYCREIVHYQNGTVIKVVGVYRDELVRINDAWLFARRDYQLFSHESPQSAST